MIRTAGISVTLFLTAVGAGCRSERQEQEPVPTTIAPRAIEGTEQPPPAPPVPPAEPSAAAQGQAAEQELANLPVTRIGIDTKLANMCEIPLSAVFFSYDSAKLTPMAKERLDQLATCATTGPAKGMALQIVGRTDPRGPDPYNKQLGMSRADAVAKYLQDQGVKQARVETASKGEQAAEVTDPVEWPLERRVTIRIVDQAQ